MNQIREALAGLNFGSLNLVVQDGVVVQIERNEKFRPSRSTEAKDLPRRPRSTS